jgi:hypothetical protein
VVHLVDAAGLRRKLPPMLKLRLMAVMIGVGLLIPGLALAWLWLAVAGVAFIAVGEGIGLRQLSEPLQAPRDRILRTLAEMLPSIGAATAAPVALGVAVTVAVFAVTASGIDTVAVSRDMPITRRPGETLRRLFTALAGLFLAFVVTLESAGVDVAGALNTEPSAVVWVAVAVVALVSVRALTDLALELRRGR